MIEAYRFGSYVIDGKEYRCDIKIFDKRVEQFEFKGHNLSFEDVEDLINSKPEYLIIGTGSSGLVNISDDIKERAAANNIKLIVEKTPLAVEEFNQLQKKGKNICAFLHGTC